MSVRAIEAEVSIKSGVQAECTIGREVIVEVHEEAVLEPLTVAANGNYTPAEGVDGFSDVSVNVPERVPVTESLSVTENGTYEPTEGIDGYDKVTVNVPATVPDIEPLTVTANGTYTASGDGFNPVTVNVPIPIDPNICEGEFTASETGVLTIDTGYDGSKHPKMITAYAEGGIMSSDFASQCRANAINAFALLKYNNSNPNYGSSAAANMVYGTIINQSSASAFLSQSTSGYPYSSASPTAGKGTFIKMPDNKTIKLYISDEGSESALFIPAGIRYKYKVFY